MTPKCVGALLARNEAAPDRYLRRVLANAAAFCDELVVLDDGSTDDTAKICRDAGCITVTHDASNGWWGAGREHASRHTLWREAVQHVHEGRDWVFVFDADHELVGVEPAAFRRLLTAENVDAWACPLWDCWDSDQTHRVDGYWQAWRSPRVWLARAYEAPTWNTRGIHSGHLPERAWRVGLFPDGAAIRHLGYINAKHRVDKRRRYLHVK